MVRSASAIDLVEKSSTASTDSAAKKDNQNKFLNEKLRSSDAIIAENVPASLKFPPNVELETTESKKAKHERFQRLFENVPSTELLVSRFSCSYITDKGVPIHGFLFVSRNWICFYANIFGLKRTIEIPINHIVEITKEKTAKILRNGIGVRTDTEQQYLFGSFWSRHNAFRLLTTLLERSRIAGHYSLMQCQHPSSTAAQTSVDATTTNTDSGVVATENGVNDATYSSLSEDDETKEEYIDDDAGVISAHRRRQRSTSRSRWRNLQMQPIGCRPDQPSASSSTVTHNQSNLLTAQAFCLIGLGIMFLLCCILSFRMVSQGIVSFPTATSDYTELWRQPMSYDVDSLDKIGAALERTIEYVQKMKGDLEELRVEFQAGDESKCD